MKASAATGLHSTARNTLFLLMFPRAHGFMGLLCLGPTGGAVGG